ncbi:D-alanine--D-alanine ligase [Alicyclobacillus sp. SO9]|uniref:D-alanine--D-alanine ligase n=1 Tax=Alicyclobacillus sp. SO9 TaxID=2665646 RepID=UPI0018E737D4|nr:D-alanine--D-alanine ligase [Alicyclobacillus sp. SO9]QQE78160.1 D-alanine--D-alanine ligase [Alicyclobacillus sp. SO9]
MTKRVRVGVIFGGRSGEHEVSVNSAKSVMQALDKTKYELVPIAIDKNGRWLTGESYLQLRDAEAQSSYDASLGESKEASTELSGQTTPEVLKSESGLVPNHVINAIDVVFPVLHGSYGEDGTIQGMLEMMNLPYVGAGVLASAVGMDKVFMKRSFSAFDLPQVQYTSYSRKAWENNPDEVMDDVEKAIGYPCFVKPANLGSSVGISKAKDRNTLKRALNLAVAYDRKVVVEQGLDAREIEVAVLGNDNPEASVPGEVTPSNEFYDYRAKYVDGDSVLTIPAPLTPEQTEEIRTLAVRAFQAVDGSGLGRVDFFVERTTGAIYVNEINTMPGFTEISMYPKLWQATGVPYPKLIERLIDFAIERYQEKEKIKTDFSLGE